MAYSQNAQRWADVTPNDSADLPGGRCLGIYVGGAGNVVLVGKDDVAVTFVGVPAGTVLPVAAKRVKATSTTATSIVALF